MSNQMSLMGSGGKIAVALVVSLAATAGVDYFLKPLFMITGNYHRLAVIAVVMVVAGFSLNLIASFGMVSAYRKGVLATGGMYSLFLNPMYTFQILITVPGLLLFFNSWLVMAALIPTFIAFKVFVKEEEKYLEEKFGDQYREYRKRVVFKFL